MRNLFSSQGSCGGSPPPPPPGCGSPEYKGDNFCDDENNNAGCEWDGGDCCGDNVNTQYCSVCECLDPNEQGGGGGGSGCGYLPNKANKIYHDLMVAIAVELTTTIVSVQLVNVQTLLSKEMEVLHHTQHMNKNLLSPSLLTFQCRILICDLKYILI